MTSSCIFVRANEVVKTQALVDLSAGAQSPETHIESGLCNHTSTDYIVSGQVVGYNKVDLQIKVLEDQFLTARCWLGSCSVVRICNTIAETCLVDLVIVENGALKVPIRPAGRIGQTLVCNRGPFHVFALSQINPRLLRAVPLRVGERELRIVEGARTIRPAVTNV